jgi:single-stranded-DNA-specific exonuclease
MQQLLSALGKTWVQKQRNNDLYWQLHNNYNVPEMVATLLSYRSDILIDNFNDFINPKIANLMPNPFHLKDMDKAVERIIQAIKQREKICLFADYDVDGATSAAILKKFLLFYGNDAQIYIPDRIREGYGPNTQALKDIQASGATLVITLDCGTVAFEPLQQAHKNGLDVIVIDHHIGTHENPSSIAVINPNRRDETSPLTYLCGAGVAFMLCSAIAITTKNDFLQDGKKYLMSLLDLVALGTICDVVPLIGLNRAFVKTGLKIINLQQNTGIKALLQVACITETITSQHLGFNIGPMINAGGRIGSSLHGATILSCKSNEIARQIAEELFTLNKTRAEMEMEIIEQAIIDIESINHSNLSHIFQYSENWHQGVIGIVASRVKDRYNLPAIIGSIITDEENGDTLIKTSCRSIYGVNIGDVVLSGVSKGLLLKGGGHAMAAGFTIKQSRVEDFIEFIHNKIAQDVAILKQNIVLPIDYNISATAVNQDLLDNLNMLAPFGCANQQPQFTIKDVIVLKIDILKETHIKIFGKCKYSGQTIGAIAFRAVGSPLGDAILTSKTKTISIACQISQNTYLGKTTPSIIITDIILSNVL